MKSPLGVLAVFVAGPLSFALCTAAPAAIEAQSSSAVSQTQAQASQSESTYPAATTVGPETIIVPGPLRSFLRMAGISQETVPDDVLPMLARNVFLHGRVNGKDTEYLVLVDRYVQRAREIQRLAGPDGAIRVAGCDDAAILIHTLGYKFEHGCNRKNADLITADAERAFLTVDSGFPLTALEEALQEGTPFTYAFPGTSLPILFSEKDWYAVSAWKRKVGGDLLDIILHDENVDRLYYAISRNDPQTRLALYRSPGLRRLAPVAELYDFYGSRICIRSGAVLVPAGAPADKDWQELVGASPESPGEFVSQLLSRDHGWLAAYFDALSRISAAQQSHLAQGTRLKQLYDAYRAYPTAHGAAIGVFPRNSNLLLLLTRLQWTPGGDPDVPGNLAAWRDIVAREARFHGGRGWARHVPDLERPDQLLQELVTASNSDDDEGLIQVYLSLSAIDGSRAAENSTMSEQTARLLANNFHQLHNWYSIFVEFPVLNDAAISNFLNTANRVRSIADPALRSNALGAFQAEVGLWQILARQKQIPSDALNAAWQSTIKPYMEVDSSPQLFDAARNSLKSILLAAGASGDISQDQIVDLLAGPSVSTPDDQRVRQDLSDRIRSVLDDQRLVSLDTLFGLYDGLDAMAHGQAVGDSLLPLADELREFEMPRPIFTNGEKATWSPLVYTSRHAELQVKTDLDRIIKSHGSAAQLEAARGRLSPFLRDTLVGLNYAYYEPPGAQVIHNNPLFVRSHDFSVVSIQGAQQVWDAPILVGVGVTAGGGAYLVGSLADLPYVLASAEEEFITPENIQALIWKEAVPGLLVDAVIPRWWGISQTELHTAALYQRAGEELLTTSVEDAQLRERVIGILSSSVPWARLDKIETALQSSASAKAMFAQILPTDTYYLEIEFRRKFPEQASLIGPENRELDQLVRNHPSETAPDRLSRDFGVPHPIFAESNSLTLLNTEPFPIASGNSSRLFAESWESSNLYWARLADELGYSPAMLNILVPELTRHMVANIFASNIDDWPALLRALEETGNQFRQGKFTIPAAITIAGNGAIANGSAKSNE